MTIVVTTNVPARFRGFLASCMLEIAPGVYTSPAMTRGVRDRVWNVLNEWFDRFTSGDASIVISWRDKNEPGGQAFEFLGVPPKSIVEHDGMYMVHKPVVSEAPEEPEV